MHVQIGALGKLHQKGAQCRRTLPNSRFVGACRARLGSWAGRGTALSAGRGRLAKERNSQSQSKAKKKRASDHSFPV
jgi:hypothetical protein